MQCLYLAYYEAYYYKITKKTIFYSRMCFGDPPPRHFAHIFSTYVAFLRAANGAPPVCLRRCGSAAVVRLRRCGPAAVRRSCACRQSEPAVVRLPCACRAPAVRRRRWCDCRAPAAVRRSCGSRFQRKQNPRHPSRDGITPHRPPARARQNPLKWPKCSIVEV